MIVEGTRMVIGLWTLGGLSAGLALGAGWSRYRGTPRWGAARIQTLTEERDRLVALLQKREVQWTGWPKAGESTWVVCRNERFDIRKATVKKVVFDVWPTDSFIRVNFAICFDQDHRGSQSATLSLAEGRRDVWTCGSVRNVTGQNADLRVLVEEAIERAQSEMNPNVPYRMVFQVESMKTVVCPEVRFVEVPFLASTESEPTAEETAQAARHDEAARIAAALEVDPDLAKEVERARHRTSS
jgi:hypothetical protein